jgi:hypothetical protein
MTTTTNSPGRGAMIDVAGVSKSFAETKALATTQPTAGRAPGGGLQLRAASRATLRSRRSLADGPYPPAASRVSDAGGMHVPPRIFPCRRDKPLDRHNRPGAIVATFVAAETGSAPARGPARTGSGAPPAGCGLHTDAATGQVLRHRGECLALAAARHDAAWADWSCRELFRSPWLPGATRRPRSASLPPGEDAAPLGRYGATAGDKDQCCGRGRPRR